MYPQIVQSLKQKAEYNFHATDVCLKLQICLFERSEAM